MARRLARAASSAGVVTLLSMMALLLLGGARAAEPPECESDYDCSVAGVVDGQASGGGGECAQWRCQNGTCSGTPKSAGTVCRASAGDCDVAEACDGVALACPTDAFQSSSTTCRAAAGACDQAESCTGGSAYCPPDALRPAGTVCRYTRGDCDAEERCTGNSTSCPPDALAPVGPRGRRKQCRAAADACDAAEFCRPDSASCPSDFRKDKGYVFRCDSTCYTCAIAPSEVQGGQLDGCSLGGCSEVSELAWPACSEACVVRKCPNGKDVALVAFANCNKAAEGAWSCVSQKQVTNPETQSFPICS